MNLHAETAAGIMTATLLFLAVGGIMWLSQRVQERRSAGVARQIALTDAIHRELGAVAAPLVRRPWRGGWTVSMAVPLEEEATVGTVVRIAHAFFATLDRAEARTVRIVLTAPERTALREATLSPGPSPTPYPTVKVTRAGARLG